MHQRVQIIRSWEFDADGRLLSYIEQDPRGYRVAQAMHYGGRVKMAIDPEDAEMMAAEMGRRWRRVG